MPEEKPSEQQKEKTVVPDKTIQPPVYDVQKHTDIRERIIPGKEKED